MNNIRSFIKNNRFLSLVILIYTGLFIVMPGKALQSAENSLYYIKEMILIMPVILLLTALITAWVPKEAIEKNLGKESGIKGSVFSFLLGSFSAGPIYAAFPVCKALLNKGASISNIVILLSTWAVIKIPMLLNEAKFLGIKFMSIRWILTTISIFLMAYIASKLVYIEDIPLDKKVEKEHEKYTLQISEEYCIGCNLCVKIAPKHFTMEDKKAIVINQEIGDSELESINEAIDKCPTKAINKV